MKNWKRWTAMSLAAASLALPAVGHAEELKVYNRDQGQALQVEQIGRYNSGSRIGEGGTEIVAYDANTKRAFSVNGAARALDILDLNGLKDGNGEIPLLKRVSLESFGVSASDVTSVAIHPEGDYIAVSVPSEVKTDPGHVVLLDTDGNKLASVEVGALPDMVTFTHDGSKVLVANEGEPSDDYTVNPEGSVSIINIANGLDNLTAETAAFTDDVDSDVRKVNPDPENSSYAENLEPEYITVDKDNRYAYVAIQESNAIAKLDLQSNSFTTVKSLGYKDFSKEGVELDPSNKDDGIQIDNWPVLSMYMPDGMTAFQSGGKTYLITANEGDAQDWEGFSEEVRVADLAAEDAYALNADLYEGYTQEQLDQLVQDGLFEDEKLGRLNTSIVAPKNADGKYEAVYGFGGRSFSIWDADSLQQVYDSGADFEKITAEAIPDYFNTTNDEDKLDNRSDDKGPEPEAVITGDVDGKTYAFIGLERTGGIMAYDVTNPTSPAFSTYFSSRNFQGDEAAVDSASGDVAPEGLTYISAEESPTGQTLLLAAHEVSGTIAAYALGEKAKTQPEPVPEEEENEQPEQPVTEPNDPEEEEPAEETTQPVNEEETTNEQEEPKPETDNVEEQTKTVTETTTTKPESKEPDSVQTAASAKSDTDDAEGQPLPNTSTNVFNWLLGGVALVAAGVIFFGINKLRKRA